MIVSVTLNPCIDHVLFVDGLQVHDTNRVVRVEKDAGGKGVNLSRVVAELGADTLATGFLGGDTGAFVRCVLDRQGVDHRFVETAAETRTNSSIEDGTGKPPTTLNEKGGPISIAELEELKGLLSELTPQCRWMALGGSLPKGVPTGVFRELALLGRAHGCKVVLDSDGDPQIEGLKARPDFIKPNGPEAERLLGRKIISDEDAILAAKDLLNFVSPDGFAVLSRGKQGAILASEEGIYIGQSPTVDAKSTIGSGDSLIGGLLWALEEGKPLPEAFAWGLASGAATAMSDGSGIAKRNDVLALVPKAQVKIAKS
jgi:1-phosphofructokinase family hexose kinase